MARPARPLTARASWRSVKPSSLVYIKMGRMPPTNIVYLAPGSASAGKARAYTDRDLGETNDLGILLLPIYKDGADPDGWIRMVPSTLE